MESMPEIESKIASRVEKAASESSIQEAFDSPDHADSRHLVVRGNSNNMERVLSDSVHLVVTSPPYFNAKEYSNWPTVEEYLHDMRQVFRETIRVLVPGRKFCLNISDLPEKGSSGVRWQPLGALLLLAAIDEGFELVDRVIWFKTPLKGFQYGSLPFPPSPWIADSMEYIYILRKPLGGRKVSYSHVTNLQKDASKLRRDDYIEYTKQIWSIRRVRRANNLDGHIAPFPIEIPQRCIRLYSFVGETVLDPFSGSGTTALAALQNRRNSVSYELQSDYIEYIAERFAEAQGLDMISGPDYGKFQVDYVG
jgi:DNA modification methylase